MLDYLKCINRINITWYMSFHLWVTLRIIFLQGTQGSDDEGDMGIENLFHETDAEEFMPFSELFDEPSVQPPSNHSSCTGKRIINKINQYDKITNKNNSTNCFKTINLLANTLKEYFLLHLNQLFKQSPAVKNRFIYTKIDLLTKHVILLTSL